MRGRTHSLRSADLVSRLTHASLASQGRPHSARQKSRTDAAAEPVQSALYQRQDTWYEFMLKQFNPDDVDYGRWLEQRRQAISSKLDSRIRTSCTASGPRLR